MKYWKKLTYKECQDKINYALSDNIDFFKDNALGYPASRLNEKVFYNEFPFFKDSPILKSYIANPNHIGCHTLGISESAFKGTQEIEKEVLNVIAVDIFKSKENEFDGYIAPGGTEANLQAIWVFRNLFNNKYNANNKEIVIIASEDTHYSIPKASNIMCIDYIAIPVNFKNRKINKLKLDTIIKNAIKKGKKYFIVVSNMGTTMFGSVDNPDTYTTILDKYNIKYKLHIDAAYGGFVYPISNHKSKINFENPKIDSITIDAHKMLQAPYGTGIYICRKNLINNVLTKEASYVEGMDLTICGSRSGANAIAVWMILFTCGPYGYFEKIKVLQMRTKWLCNQLDKLNIEYYKEEKINIVTIEAKYISPKIAHKFSLVPEIHNKNNKWYKIIIMEHVEAENLMYLIEDLKNNKKIMNKENNIEFKMLKTEHIEQAAKILTDQFLKHESISNYLQFSETEFLSFTKSVCEKAVLDQLSVIAIENNKIIACLIVDDYKSVINKKNEIELEKFDILEQLFDTLSKKYKTEIINNNKKIAHFFMIAVDEKYAGKGIANKLVKKAEELVKRNNYNTVILEAMGTNSQYISKKHGYKILNEVNYSNFLYKRKKVFSGVDNSLSCKLMEKSLN